MRFNKIHFFLICFTITNVIYGIMMFKHIPYLMTLSNGMPIFDMMPGGYDYNYAFNLLVKLKSSGMNYYLKHQLFLDKFYPVGFIFTYDECDVM